MKKIHMPICMSGRANEGLEVYHRAWFENRRFVEKHDEIADALRREGFIILNFNTPGLSFDPYSSDDASRGLTQEADLVLALREQNSLGFGPVLKAMREFGKPGLEFVSEDASPDLYDRTGIPIKTFGYTEISTVVEAVKNYAARAA